MAGLPTFRWYHRTDVPSYDAALGCWILDKKDNERTAEGWDSLTLSVMRRGTTLRGFFQKGGAVPGYQNMWWEEISDGNYDGDCVQGQLMATGLISLTRPDLRENTVTFREREVRAEDVGASAFRVAGYQAPNARLINVQPGGSRTIVSTQPLGNTLQAIRGVIRDVWDLQDMTTDGIGSEYTVVYPNGVVPKFVSSQKHPWGNLWITKIQFSVERPIQIS